MWKEEYQTNIACGRCPGCTKKRASCWGFRLEKEEERSRSSFFITLTYDTASVKFTKNGFLTVDKSDCQKFFKRLRKKHNKHAYAKLYPIKYYLAAEYGDTRKRPHYHAIIFNAEEQDIIDAWTNPETKKAIGTIYFGTVNGASIAYSLKYISKPRTIPIHKRDDRTKEFSLMSKGIGSNYLTPAMIHWHKDDLLKRYYIPKKGGQKNAMPKYYREKIYTKEEFGLLKGELEKIQKQNHENFIKLHGENWRHIKSQKDLAAWKKMYKKNLQTSF